MPLVVSVLFALLTAACNGTASVLQRMAAQSAPANKALHLSLFGYLIRRKVWLAGIGMVILAAVCQAAALDTGPVALVQPIFIIELPFTLLVASKLMHRRLPATTWWATLPPKPSFACYLKMESTPNWAWRTWRRL